MDNTSIYMIVNSLLKVTSYLFLGTIVYCNTLGISINRKLKLYKLSKYKGKIIIDQNDIFKKIENIPKDEINLIKGELLAPYVIKLREFIGDDELKIVYNNIKTLKTIRFLSPYIFLGATGIYDAKKNKIYYLSKNTLGHEFLHMASTTYDKTNNIIMGGFYQKKSKDSIGNGLDEGYTELLNSRLYNKKNKVQAYPGLVKINKMLELFFDDPKDMACLYFNSNLPGLIKQLEKYASREEIINLIIDMDNILNFSGGLGMIKGAQLQIRLYNWFAKKCEDPKKIEKLKILACQNKLVSLMLNNKKIKLYKDSPYNVNKNYKKR